MFKPDRGRLPDAPSRSRIAQKNAQALAHEYAETCAAAAPMGAGTLAGATPPRTPRHTHHQTARPAKYTFADFISA